jgi:phosphate transport system protein
MEHTFTAIDEELKALAANLGIMGDLAVDQVRDAVAAFGRQDVEAAGRITEADAQLDELDARIEQQAIRFIALRQPMADDLRRPIAAMKSAAQLERCGDLAKNIAKRIARMQAAPAPAQVGPLVELGELAANRLSAVVAAFKGDDAAAAHDVWATDTQVDEKHEAVMREIVVCMGADPASIGDCTHLLFIAKNLERIGDHATNIAELVYYQVTGVNLADRPKL